MAKAKARRKKDVSSSSATSERSTPGTTLPVTRTRTRNDATRRPAAAMRSSQSMFMAGVVALGCWGFAFTFAFLTQDANRYVYGGMAALIALMWSGMFGMRFYKWQQRRQSIN